MTIKKKQSNWGGKREGAGRKPKPASEKPEKGTHGGRREGAGRKVRGSDGPLSAQDVFCVSEVTHSRIRQLRQLTKQDDMPFNRMFEAWVEVVAKEYGIE